jgi:two-component system nitrogen regulation response regulator NtrX
MKALSTNILVIDDDLDTCNFLREIFEDVGFHVSSALNADAALEAVRSSKFDLIVSDINLNDRLNGIALLRTFRDLSPSTQVILISGFGTLETAIESVREGAFDFISKPFNVQEVIAVSRRAIESAGAEASAGGDVQ